MFEQSVNTYTDFLATLPRKEVIVISAPLPTIKDGSDWGEVADLRKGIHATQAERTELTLRFNIAVQNYCSKKQITYINLDYDSLGEDGLVQGAFIHKNCFDHHYDRLKYAITLSSKLMHRI